MKENFKLVNSVFIIMIKVKLEKFEGPLSLLMKLIEQEELDVTEVSIARVADQFIEYINSRSAIDPEETADFLVVAARLLLIKSKALLPYLYPEEEEEIKEFEDQLKMYQEFLAATKKIQEMIGEKRFMFSRPFNRKAIQAVEQFSPPKDLKAHMMSGIFEEIIIRIKPAEQQLREEVLERKINIEDKILEIQQSLLSRIKVGFNKIMSEAKNKTEIIVSFLAMLELVRMREVDASQEELFGEIEINKL